MNEENELETILKARIDHFLKTFPRPESLTTLMWEEELRKIIEEHSPSDKQIKFVVDYYNRLKKNSKSPEPTSSII